MENDDEINSSFDLELNTPPPSPLKTPSPKASHPSNVMSEMTACIRNISLRSPTSIKRDAAIEPLPKISDICWIPDVGQVFNVLVISSSNPFNFMVSH